MRILGCIVKSVLTMAALVVMVVLLSAALPDSPGVTRWVGALTIVSALGWVTLTIWWSLRLRPPRPRPVREPRVLEMPGPREVRILLALLCVPVVLGFVVMLYQNGFSASVLIGGILGPTLAVLFHRHQLRQRSLPGGGR